MSSKSPGTLLIRADASLEIGIGHVMRCLALAQAWQDQGGDVVFVTANPIPVIEQQLKDEGFVVNPILATIGGDGDAKRTVEIANDYAARWVVLDGYRFGARYQSLVKAGEIKILCVDDLGMHDAYSADMILNQNIQAREDMYSNRPANSRCLLGPRFALLRREFRVAPPRKSQIETMPRVFIMMGGSDPTNATPRVLDEILAIPGPLHILVVVGPGNSHVHSFDRTWSHGHHVEIVRNPTSLAGLMHCADIAISAAGSTVWEMCRLGVPAILVSITDNQISGAEELGRRGIVAYLGVYHAVKPPVLAETLCRLLSSSEQRHKMSHLGQALVDGRGALRVLAAMQCVELNLRPARQEDCWLLWEWANDTAVRAASFQSESISRDEHASWFAHRLQGTGALIYIAEDSCGNPIGQFRVEWDAEECGTVSVSIAPEWRGSGIAFFLISRAAQAAFKKARLLCLKAKIKPDNIASLRAFEKAGFSDFKQSGDSIYCFMKRASSGDERPAQTTGTFEVRTASGRPNV